MDKGFSGGCACGAVRYKCSAGPLGMLNCHCRDCQYASGSSHTAVVVVPTPSVEVEGESLKYYDSIADSGTRVFRGFCSVSGSPLFAKNEKYQKDFLAIKAASMDDPSRFKPGTDIWTDSAQPWDIMHPDMVKFPGEMQG